ncbi:MAG: hypothetical protein COA84_15600, partial [Robiginitomaculum sp.]
MRWFWQKKKKETETDAPAVKAHPSDDAISAPEETQSTPPESAPIATPAPEETQSTPPESAP